MLSSDVRTVTGDCIVNICEEEHKGSYLCLTEHLGQRDQALTTMLLEAI